MIERYENIIQIAVLFCCILAALYKALTYKSRTWSLLAFFYGGLALGDLFWLFCLILFGQTPQMSIVSDLSWYASYLFLYLLLRHIAPPVQNGEKRLLPWLGFVFTFGIAVFFMQWGEVMTNLAYAFLMGMLICAAVRRLTEQPRRSECRYFCILILVFCLLEYALWISSCFWTEEGIGNPYYWIDFLLTVCYTFFLPATRKAVAP